MQQGPRKTYRWNWHNGSSAHWDRWNNSSRRLADSDIDSLLLDRSWNNSLLNGRRRSNWGAYNWSLLDNRGLSLLNSWSLSSGLLDWSLSWLSLNWGLGGGLLDNWGLGGGWLSLNWSLSWLWSWLLWSGTWSGGETAGLTGGSEGDAVVAPDVDVVWAGAGEALGVEVEEVGVLAWGRLLREGDGGAWEMSV